MTNPGEELKSLDAAFGVFDDDDEELAQDEAADKAPVHSLPVVPIAKKSKTSNETPSSRRAGTLKDLLKEQPRLSDETSTSVEKAYSLPATSLLGSPAPAPSAATGNTSDANAMQQDATAAEEKIVVKHQVRYH